MSQKPVERVEVEYAFDGARRTRSIAVKSKSEARKVIERYKKQLMSEESMDKDFTVIRTQYIYDFPC